MIVVWKWLFQNVREEQRIGGGKVNYDFLPVKNQPNDFLLRYDPESDIKESFNFLKAQVSNYAKTHQIQLFLHVSHGYSKDRHSRQIEAFLIKGGKTIVDYYFFGNVNDHLYIRIPESRYGLLGFDGNLGGEFGYEIIKVYDLDDSRNILLKQAHFNSTWDFYYYKFKRRTYEMMEQLVQFYWPLTESGYKISENEETTNSIFQQLEAYVGIIDGKPDKFGLIMEYPDFREALYYKPEVIQLLDDLKKGFSIFETSKSEISRAHLTTLRNAFINLLNALPEKTYA